MKPAFMLILICFNSTVFADGLKKDIENTAADLKMETQKAEHKLKWKVRQILGTDSSKKKSQYDASDARDEAKRKAKKPEIESKTSN